MVVRPICKNAAGPIANPMEMVFSHSFAIDVLRSIPQYVAEFNKIYDRDEITLDHVTNVITAYVIQLKSPVKTTTGLFCEI